MSDNYIKNVVEAALLAAGRPLQLTELAQLFDENARPEPAGLRAALDALDADYSSRGIEVKETASGFRIQVRKEMANEVSRLWPERPPKYSRALLETLALIAYRQPITRGEIEAVRGVAVNPNIIKTVIERNWVHVVGTRDVPGRPELLGTTKDFLDYFGLRALDELPPLAELKAMGDVNLQLDLAKPSEGSDDGSSGSGSSGASGGGEGGGAAGDGGGGGAPSDSSVAAVGAAAVAAVGAAGTVAAVAADATSDSAEADGANDSVVASDVAAPNAADAVSEATVASSDNVDASDALVAADDLQPADLETGDDVEAQAATSAAPESLAEVATAHDAATSDDAIANPPVASNTEDDSAPELAPLPATEEFVAYEHDPHAATITHVDIESDPGDVTVEVEALTFVEQQLEAEERAKDTSIETGEFEMSELGLSARQTPVIEAEFEADDISSAPTDEDDAADADADDDEELSAGPQSSTELVAAPPRDRDD